MHIYIHVPFCTSKCPYCAFGSFSDKFSLVRKYFSALRLEVRDFLAKNPHARISTLFIGGGTPSAVDAELYDEIFALLTPHFAAKAEISSEANPNSASPAWLRAMRELGVNRISFGAQSFNDAKLKFLGRAHSAEQIFLAVQNAKAAGFDNINLDLIYASKFDDKRNLKFEMDELARCEVPHLSAYALSLEENTPFFGRESFKKESAALAKFLFALAADSGFSQYEISNFAARGLRCKHNLAYWRGEDYAGFGAFAVGTSAQVRLSSPKNLRDYIADPLQKHREVLSAQDKRLERIFLGLRCVLGFEAQILDAAELSNAQLLVREKKLKFAEGKFYNPNFLLADEIALFITQESHCGR
ncbi:radical SAM family heme chaperone HemW [uncultured Campylobacter sp.]|uniref:radical SAM family heme chaperone HemW n=1 Tax=uncultured Campylobacter sp. TaxID=218934 RepID=UPI0026220F3A|nr:radical SAM family heme chaperone HemW [uncultured Campylobacter sp.]